MAGVRDRERRLGELAERRQSVTASLATATAAHKKCRQKSGADAHKRAWYFEGKMKEYQTELARLDEEAAKLNS